MVEPPPPNSDSFFLGAVIEVYRAGWESSQQTGCLWPKQSVQPKQLLLFYCTDFSPLLCKMKFWQDCNTGCSILLVSKSSFIMLKNFKDIFMSLLFKLLMLKSLTVILIFLPACYQQLLCTGAHVYQSDILVCGKYQHARLFLPSQSRYNHGYLFSSC